MHYDAGRGSKSMFIRSMSIETDRKYCIFLLLRTMSFPEVSLNLCAIMVSTSGLPDHQHIGQPSCRSRTTASISSSCPLTSLKSRTVLILPAFPFHPHGFLPLMFFIQDSGLLLSDHEIPDFYSPVLLLLRLASGTTIFFIPFF